MQTIHGNFLIQRNHFLSTHFAPSCLHFIHGN